MKLRNLAFAALAAVAFTACSNDNEPTPTPEAGTTLSIKLAGMQTKAVSSLDATVKSLLVIIAQMDGTIIETIAYPANATAVQDRYDSEPQTVLPASIGRRQIVVLANVDESEVVGTSLSTLAVRNFAQEGVVAGEEPDNLSMNSKAYTVDIMLGYENFLGYTLDEATAKADGTSINAIPTTPGTTPANSDYSPVKLYRNVAKAYINAIKFAPNTDFLNNYPNATFTVDTIMVTQSRGTTNLIGAGAAEWGATSPSTLSWISPWDYLYFQTIGDNFEKAGTVTKYDSYIKAFTGQTALVANATASSAYATYPFYVYENTTTRGSLNRDLANGAIDQSLYTLMTIKGHINYTATDGSTLTVPNRYYSFALGVSGTNWPGFTLPAIGTSTTEFYYDIASGRDIEEGENVYGVFRNLQYNVELTIKGLGTPKEIGGEDETNLDVQVQVVPWGKVTQPVDIN